MPLSMDAKDFNSHKPPKVDPNNRAEMARYLTDVMESDYKLKDMLKRAIGAEPKPTADHSHVYNSCNGLCKVCGMSAASVKLAAPPSNPVPPKIGARVTEAERLAAERSIKHDIERSMGRAPLIMTLENMPLDMIDIANLPGLSDDGILRLYCRDDVTKRHKLFLALCPEIDKRGLREEAGRRINAEADRLQLEREGREQSRRESAIPPLAVKAMMNELFNFKRDRWLEAFEELAKKTPPPNPKFPDTVENFQAMKLARRMKRADVYKLAREAPMRARRAEQEAALGVAMEVPAFDRKVMLGTVRS